MSITQKIFTLYAPYFLYLNNQKSQNLHLFLTFKSNNVEN